MTNPKDLQGPFNPVPPSTQQAPQNTHVLSFDATMHETMTPKSRSLSRPLTRCRPLCPPPQPSIFNHAPTCCQRIDFYIQYSANNVILNHSKRIQRAVLSIQSDTVRHRRFQETPWWCPIMVPEASRRLHGAMHGHEKGCMSGGPRLHRLFVILIYSWTSMLRILANIRSNVHPSLVWMPGWPATMCACNMFRSDAESARSNATHNV